ncbi:CCCH-type zinc finger protein with ARM repeat domain-containing protein [Actinidia rufa]|uniref:CCCH-type zinc finger protein with ARM repeat domain-containing protein n=1 Tax=Actinidia rufa TaxID=165716 RepID=A0A7J0F206_9ERIC|nr:CCCH-type zinc finger protein with ARM repeat domain-containing protein [Actinidia rufa]
MRWFLSSSLSTDLQALRILSLSRADFASELLVIATEACAVDRSNKNQHCFHPQSSFPASVENNSNTNDMTQFTSDTNDSFSSLLELAANNEFEGFKLLMEQDPSPIDGVGLWYGRKKGSKQIALEHRTPLMVAATYGSIDVLKLILSQSEVDVNLSCGFDKSTALHCAASGGSVNAVDVVKLLLSAGADPNSMDAGGLRPVDVIVVSPKLPGMRAALEELLANSVFDGSVGDHNLQVSITTSNSDSPTLSSSPGNGSPRSPSDSVSSPMGAKFNDLPSINGSEKKEYPIDPSLPDIKNSIYSTDEFRSAVSSPRSNAASASAMDMAAALSLFPGSPSSLMSPIFNQPMSPSGNGISHSSMAWPQPNVPTLNLPGSNLQSLNLPGSNLQSSRLRSSLHARDIALENMNMLPDFDAQNLLNDLACFSQTRSNSASLNRSCLTKTLTPSNLEELFSAEIASSPRYSDQAAACGVFSPSHKSAVHSQFQQQQNMLSPINTNVFSPTNVEHPFLQASFGVSSPRGMSPRCVEPISPMSARLSAIAQRDNKQYQQLRSLSSRELGYNPSASIVGSPVNPVSKWGSPNGKADWSVNGSEMGRLRRSSSFELNSCGEEPDLSWVQSLVKESPSEMNDILAVPVSGISSSGEAVKPNSQVESVDHSVLGAWLEQMQLDQLVA